MKPFRIIIIALLVSAVAATAQHSPPPQQKAGSSMAGMHHHDESSAAAIVSYSELKRTLDTLERTRKATDKYHDIHRAQADGYRQIGPDLPGMGIHYLLNASPEKFEPEKPPILLYESNQSVAGGYSLVGVAYLLNAAEGPEGQPQNPPFPKSLALWHRHANICMMKDGTHTMGATEEKCRQKGGNFTLQSQWMIHAWIWKDSPLGLFSPTNPLVSTQTKGASAK